MKKVVASLVVLFFFSATFAQQSDLQNQSAEANGSTDLDANQEIEFTVEVQNPPMGPMESLCRDLIVNHQSQGNAAWGVGASAAVLPYVVLGTREALGVPTSDAYAKTLWISTGTVSTGAATWFLIDQSRQSTLNKLKGLIEQSQMCIQHQLCSDENFEEYAEHVISENVDIERFAATVQNNTHSFCKTEKKENGRYSVRIKSGHAIKKILQNRYGLTS